MQTNQFIEEHLHSDINTLLLQRQRFPDINWTYAIEQIEGRQRALQKLPAFVNNPKIIFPKKLSLEQCSSELTAEYKAQFAVGKQILDATGGFGVDSFYFSKQAKSVVYIEQQPELCDIAKHNFEQLLAKNITVEPANCMDFLQQNDVYYDLIYLDPARRGTNNSKKFLLSDCEPDVVKHLDFLFEKTSEILIKTSPMLDISLAIEQLRHVAEIHIISVKNECKEVLFLCKKQATLHEITCVNLDDKNRFIFKFSPENERCATPVFTDFSNSLPNYLYDSLTCLTKAGAFKILCNEFDVEKISQHAHLYTSQDYKADFPGRHFEILKQLPIDKKSFSGAPIFGKANIICKHFPHTPSDIRKIYKITDGGEYFLFFTTSADGKKLCLLAKRI